MKYKINIDYNRDKLLSEFSIKTLQDRYFSGNDSSPQDVFARASTAFASNTEHAQRIYDYMSNLWFMGSTPILSNGGTDRGLPISCFLNYTEDSREGICYHYTENAFLSSIGGGLGGYWGDVRSVGTRTSRGSESTGVIPFIGVVDREMLAFSQGVTRRGGYAAYLDVSHPEIEEFLDIRKPTGGDINRRSINIHHAVILPDKFMELIEQASLNPGFDDSWDLVDPHTGKVVKTVPAKVLWIKILQNRIETGEPYIMFSDTVNEAMPQFQKDLGLRVNHSNLCVSGSTNILTEKGYFPIAELENQAVRVWNGKEFSDTEVVKTGANQELIRVTFSNGMSLECTPYHKFYLEGVDTEIQAKDLEVGNVLISYTIPETKDTNLTYVKGVTVESIEPVEGLHDTFCFNEPKEHKGVFNGVLTGQCSEITLATNSERTAVCCLSSLNLEEYDQWKDHPTFIADVVEFLDNVLDYFIEEGSKFPFLSKAVYSAKMERSIGLGTMGFHAFLQRRNVPFESAIAKSLNKNMYKSIQEKAIAASKELAKVRGECPDGVGSGMRNAHLMAIAPNASSSIICGNTSPSIEPYRANAFVQKTNSGTSLLKNEYLENILRDLGMDTPEVWRQIMNDEGSVQGLDFLDDYTKDVFKTASEIDNMWLVEFAADRQPYICQAQSLNLFLPANVTKQELHALHIRAWKLKVKTLYYLRSTSFRRTEKVSEVALRQLIINATEEDTCLACEG